MYFTIALLLIAASPEAANTAASPDAAQAKPVKVKKVCRAGSATGTRMSNKICKTQSEWDAQLGADATKLDNQRNSGAGN